MPVKQGLTWQSAATYVAAGFDITQDEKQRVVMAKYVYNIRVLAFREDDGFTARALEMDLVGCGKTANEALAALQEAVEAQISFSIQMKDASLLNFPAEQKYFDAWEKAQSGSFVKSLAENALDNPRSVFISAPRGGIKASRSNRFDPEPAYA